MKEGEAGFVVEAQFVTADILNKIARPVMVITTELAAGYAVKCGFTNGDPYQIVLGLGGMGGILLGEARRRNRLPTPG